MIGYANTGYLSYPRNAKSQAGFVLASRECVRLCRMINQIQQSCGIGSIEAPTIIYEDNVASIV